MDGVSAIARIKELITRITEADKAYYGEDDPIMTDREYDALVEELEALEKQTGVVFANSPTRRVGGSNSAGLKRVPHSRPMLSARKTKSREDAFAFMDGMDVVLSRKLDGLTLVLRYQDGVFKQALTRGEGGIEGEDVTHSVRFLRGAPGKIPYKGELEVRGEGVVSWSDFELLNRNEDVSHPRNVAAGEVRTLTPDKGRLSHIDFIAFDLIRCEEEPETKEEELDFLSLNGFFVVEHEVVPGSALRADFEKAMDRFAPEGFPYPVDGIILEYNDISYGKSLGETAHHENRMLAFKWEDGTYETVFRGVELGTTRSGLVSLTAIFDPVTIDGAQIKRADLHSLSNFEKYAFGIGDRITVYKANMIFPQIEENLTKSGNYALPRRCPCCGVELETRVSVGGCKNLYCPNEACMARNAQKIARFCDKNAMDIPGLNANVLENMMAFGFIRSYADLYHLEEKREKILTSPGFGFGFYQRIIEAVEQSRRTRLSKFLVAVGVPMMGPANARAIEEYFENSWEAFEQAIRDDFCFFHIAGISQALSRNIHRWYRDEKEAKLWRPVLKEITFGSRRVKSGVPGNPFYRTSVVVTGTVNGMNRKDVTELLSLLGAEVKDSVTTETNYLIVGEAPGVKKLSAALQYGVRVIPEGHFAKMLAASEVGEEE